MNTTIDILIPTCERPYALAVTLTSLIAQTFNDFRIVISDQSRGLDTAQIPEVRAVMRVMEVKGHPIRFHKHLPKKGMAEQRAFLLSQALSPYALFLDDDVILEPFVVKNLMRAIQEEGCGLVGNGLIGLSYIEDVRVEEQGVEFIEGPVKPEFVAPGTKSWERHKLHNAANLYHVQKALGISPSHPLKYRIAWVGGCVLYDTSKLRSVGGFDFWRSLPKEHCGEDVLAQLRVMARFGGCGILPSGAYHQELKTTLPYRQVNAPEMLLPFESPRMVDPLKESE